MAGAGAVEINHLDALKNIAGVEVVSLVSEDIEATRSVADKHDILHATTDLSATLALKGVDAVILATPTPCTPNRQ